MHFLKILEEPPLDTLIILMTPDENLLIETILSRCQKISFSSLTRERLTEVLAKSYSLNNEQLEFVLNYSGGRIRKDFISNVAILYPMRQQVLSILMNLSVGEMVGHLNLLEQWVKKDLQGFFLEFCASWFKDFLYLGQNQPERLTNRDIIDEFKDKPSPLTSEQLIWAFELTVETEMAIKANAAKMLAVESLIVQIKQLQNGAVAI